MSNMFNEALSFNQPIGNWNIDNVTDMSNIFEDASSFDRSQSPSRSNKRRR